jgi:hypothetical protein
VDEQQIAEGLRVCEAATKGPCRYDERIGCIAVYPGPHRDCLVPPGDCVFYAGGKRVEGEWTTREQDRNDGKFIALAYGNAEGTTGYAAALTELATAQAEFKVLQTAYLKLLAAVQEWRDDDTAGEDMGMCRCGKCPSCILRALAENTATPPPPFPADEERERLERDAAAYRELLEAGRACFEAIDVHDGPCANCGDCEWCKLAFLVDNAEPSLPHTYCDGKRQGES